MMFDYVQTKCVQYWPNGKTAKFGEIIVTIVVEEEHALYVKRIMSVSLVSRVETLSSSQHSVPYHPFPHALWHRNTVEQCKMAIFLRSQLSS